MATTSHRNRQVWARRSGWWASSVASSLGEGCGACDSTKVREAVETKTALNTHTVTYLHMHCKSQH